MLPHADYELDLGEQGCGQLVMELLFAMRKLVPGQTLLVTAYDPAAAERARAQLNSNVEFVNSPYEAAAEADALLILTEWEEFATLDLDRLYKQLKYPIVIDGRNLYDPELMAARGFTYYSVGRPTAMQEKNPDNATPLKKNTKS